MEWHLKTFKYAKPYEFNTTVKRIDYDGWSTQCSMLKTIKTLI
jgi:hypothetical protein